MNYKSTFGKSTAWMSLAAGGSSIVSFFIFIVLSWLLNPEDIGLVAFALIIVFLGLFVALVYSMVMFRFFQASNHAIFVTLWMKHHIN
jgi:O-antigen/teichoic acid export membrane protein